MYQYTVLCLKRSDTEILCCCVIFQQGALLFVSFQPSVASDWVVALLSFGQQLLQDAKRNKER